MNHRKQENQRKGNKREGTGGQIIERTAYRRTGNCRRKNRRTRNRRMRKRRTGDKRKMNRRTGKRRTVGHCHIVLKDTVRNRRTESFQKALS